MPRRPALLPPLALLAACALPARPSLDPLTAIPREDRIDLLDHPRLSLVTAPTLRLARERLEVTFVARSRGAGAARLEAFSAEAWTDTDGDGAFDPTERGRSASAREPAGCEALLHRLVVPYHPGTPLAFRVHAVLNGVHLEQHGELQTGT